MSGRVIDFLFCLFVFSLGFEYWDLFGLLGIASVSKILFILYVVSALIYYKEQLFIIKGRAPFGFILMWLALYLVINIATSADQPVNYSSASITTATNILMFIVVTNHLIIRGYLLLDKVFIFITLIPVVQVALLANGIGIGLADGFTIDEDRLFFFGDNPNNIGFLSAFASVVAISIFMQTKCKAYKIYLIVALVCGLFVIMQTASRGAIISFSAGTLLLTIFTEFSLKKKLLYSFFVLSALGVFYFYIQQDDFIFSRMVSLFKEGDDSRIALYEAIKSFAFDSPIWGLGEVGYYNNIVSVYGQFKASHNGLLDIYLYTGIIGAFFFLGFLYLIFKYCWRLKKRCNISIALVIFIITLFNFSKSGGGWSMKPMWVAYAICLSLYYMNLYRISNASR